MSLAGLGQADTRAEEFKKDRLLTLNDIKQRVGSLRTKIRSNLQDGGDQAEMMLHSDM